MTATSPHDAPQSPAPPLGRQALRRAVPALVIGVLSGIILIAVSEAADWLQAVIWEAAPALFGVTDTTTWWTFGTLTLTGLVVGLLVWLMPGNAGPDPATTGLVASPLRLRVLPGLVIVVVVGLAGGVSLGPENPIIAINTAVVVALLARLWPRIPVPLAVLLTAAGTIGALFGTPVGAALVLTGLVGQMAGGELWDKLFLPLVAAGAGSLTMVLFGAPTLSLSVPALDSPTGWDLVAGVAVGLTAVLLGYAAVRLFPVSHRIFHAVKNPVIPLTIAGALLGVLGVIGGPDSLFKGLDQMKDLTDRAGLFTAWQLTVVVLVKILALVIAASAGFRGGRIFPAAFLGVAIGLVAVTLVPGVSVPIVLASGILGFVLVIARDGWLALFMATLMVGDIGVLPLLCVIILPLWLLVSRMPPMLISPTEPAATSPIH